VTAASTFAVGPTHAGVSTSELSARPVVRWRYAGPAVEGWQVYSAVTAGDAVYAGSTGDVADVKTTEVRAFDREDGTTRWAARFRAS
jgi:outer membrane protein assembly factor BamB